MPLQPLMSTKPSRRQLLTMERTGTSTLLSTTPDIRFQVISNLHQRSKCMTRSKPCFRNGTCYYERYQGYAPGKPSSRRLVFNTSSLAGVCASLAMLSITRVNSPLKTRRNLLPEKCILIGAVSPEFLSGGMFDRWQRWPALPVNFFLVEPAGIKTNRAAARDIWNLTSPKQLPTCQLES